MTASKDDTLDRVGSFLGDQADLRLGVVFGSLAEGRSTASSDLDVAVLGQRPLDGQRRMQLIKGLAAVTGRPVDLVDLAAAGIPVARSALLKGRVVFSRDDAAYPEQVCRLLVDSADFLPYRDRLLKERRETWIR